MPYLKNKYNSRILIFKTAGFIFIIIFLSYGISGKSIIWVHL